MPQAETLGSAVPGTVVPSGSLITPAGDQGPVGSQGPVGPQGPTPPLADITQNGLLKQVSGVVTDYVGGDNLCHPLAGVTDASPVVLGATAAVSKYPSGIIVPSYLQHPDRIISSPSAFDDHFDGSTLNAKWTLDTTGSRPPVNLVNTIGNSRLSFGGQSGSTNDGLDYTIPLSQNVPNTNAFSVTFRWDTILVGQTYSGSIGGVRVRLYNPTSNVGVEQWLYVSYSATYSLYITGFNSYGGTNVTTFVQTMGLSKIPKYIKISWRAGTTSSPYYVDFLYSEDGVAWMLSYTYSPAQTGFSSSIAPTRFYIISDSKNFGISVVHLDWIKFTNP